MQPGQVVGLAGAGRMLWVPKDEHGLQSIPAWEEPSCVSGYLAF